MKFLISTLALFWSSVVFGQGINASYLRMTPTALPALCRTGDVRVNSSGNLLDVCTSTNTWSALLSGVVGVASGGTGDTTLAAHGVLVGEGTSAVNVTSTGSAGQLLASTGSTTDPMFQTVACSSLSNGAASCSTDTTNAANISSGTLPFGRMPALTGDVTASAGSTATTVSKIQGTAVSGTTGSGNVVFSTSPSFTTSALMPDGTAAVPGLAWTSEQSTGFYRAAPGDLVFEALGVQGAEALKSGTGVNWGFGLSGTVQSATNAPMTFYSNHNQEDFFNFGNINNGTGASTIVQVQSGTASQYFQLVNFGTYTGTNADSGQGQLNGGVGFFGNSNMTQAAIGDDYSLGFVNVYVGGRSSTNKIVSVNTSSVALKSGVNLQLNGSVSGAVTFAASTGSYTMTLPATAGSPGQCLASQGGGSAQMTWAACGGGFTAPTYQYFNAAGKSTTATTSTSTACLTTVGSTVGIFAGMGITDSTSATAITNGTYVVGVPGSCSAGQIQMSANGAQAHVGDTLVFGATKTTTSSISTGNNCLSSIGSTAGFAPGAEIIDTTNPSAESFPWYIVAIPGTCSAGQVQTNQVAISSHSGDTIVVGGAQYTLPTITPLYIEVTMVGGGGGGGGAQSGGGTSGSGGQNSIFSTLQAGGGGGGGVGSAASGAGGTPGSNSGTAMISYPGGYGGEGATDNGGAGGDMPGGFGGVSPFGGAGSGTHGGGATAAAVGSGSGGGGASSANSASYYGAGGGAAGGYIQHIITSPAANYHLLVGNGGAAGTGTVNGGAGGDGFILVKEYYQ